MPIHCLEQNFSAHPKQMHKVSCCTHTTLLKDAFLKRLFAVSLHVKTYNVASVERFVEKVAFSTVLL